METRSRKRAEARARRPSPVNNRNKRARLRASSPPSASSAPQRRPSTRTLTLSSQQTGASRMESSAFQSRRDRNPKEPVKESDRRRGEDVEKKGKRKEAEKERQRQGERERDKLSRGGDEEDEENDDEGRGGGEEEEAAGSFHHDRPSASSALGLLWKFVTGIDDEDLVPLQGRFKKILTGLRADGEIGRQIEALTQLCEILSFGTEDSLSSFSVDSFVPVLVGLLNYENNSDIMLLAARALTQLCDILPSSCAAVVHYGAVRCLCARLLTIEYMDLAEQCLQALEKISREHPVACLRAGALMAVLSYLDFFSTGVQRVALSTAANICKQLPFDLADFAMAAVPTLINLLPYHDSKVVEHASVCLARIVESFAAASQNLDELCNHGLVLQAAQLISMNNSGSAQSSISTSTYTSVIRLLSTCASGSALSAKSLLDIGISSILRDTLAGPALVSRMPVPPSLNRPPDQLYEIVTLMNGLLPSLPQGAISLPTSAHMGLNDPVRKHAPRISTGKSEDACKAMPEISSREKLLCDQPELLKRFGMDLFPVLVQVYGSSVNASIRQKCLTVISKLLYFSTADMLKSLLRATNISSFLAGVLSCKDPQVLVPALQMAEVLMKKLPDVFSRMFLKEGVVYAVDMLMLSGPSNVSLKSASTSGKDQDGSMRVVPKIRRNRRHGGVSEGKRLEELKVPAAGKGGPAPSGDVKVSDLQAIVSAYAKHFKDTYFPGDSGAIGAGATDSLCKLKSLCMKLNALTDPKVKTKGKAKCVGSVAANNHRLLTVVGDILAELSKGDGVSTFEFVGSGVVASLLNFFSGGMLCKKNMSETDLLHYRQQALKRFQLFIEVSLPLNYAEGGEVPLTILVRKLQDALASLECFPVFLSHAPRSRSGNASVSAGLTAFSQPFKLRLCRARCEKSLRDHSSIVIRVDPLASLAAVEDFLWPRVQINESIQKSSMVIASDSSAGQPGITRASQTASRPSTRSRSSMAGANAPVKELGCANASSVKGKGKAVSESVADDTRGPQTRSAIRRRVALKQQQGGSGDQDEDLDVSPVELDETVAREEDDFFDDDDEEEDEDDEEHVMFGEELGRLSVAESVHDVQLGDAVDAGAVASTSATIGDIALHPSSGVGSRGAVIFTGSGETGELMTSLRLKGPLSFATAAMSGHASGSAKAVRGSRDYQSLPRANIPNVCPRLNFFMGGRQLNRSSTLYQAIQSYTVAGGAEERYNASDFSFSDSRKLWDEVHNITYQRADTPEERASIGSTVNCSIPTIVKSGLNSNSKVETLLQNVSLIDSILQGKLPCDLQKSDCPYDILLLLRVVEGLNRLAPCLRAQGASNAFAEGKISSLDELKVKGPVVAQEEFLSSKLTPKLVRQMQDALALCKGNVPSWCHQLTKVCPFLFPFETRRQYFYSTAFGLSRALQYLQQQQSAEYPNSTNDRESRLGRLRRQKVRISRNRILDSAAKVMEMYAGQKAVLEVEYFGEVGTGLGPTLEFYTLISHELQKSGLGMWRTWSYTVESDAERLDVFSLPAKKDDQEVTVGNGEYVQATLGLFPCPYPPNMDSSTGNQFSKVIDYFRLLGRVMAKALQDGRLLDLHLSTAFYKLVLGQELDLHDIRSFDLELGTTLQEMQVLVCRKQFLESISGDKREAISNLRYRGSSIEDLCLDFTLPGYPDYALKPGGNSILVNIDNMEEYVSLVVDATIRTGVMPQMEAFQMGFNEVFPITSLQIFADNELDSLLCGGCSLWVGETLTDNIKFDHGYTAQSPPILNLIDIMVDFTPDQQRAFLQFVTGSPRLPPGGLAALNPRLTVVRKNSTGVNGGPNAASLSAQDVDADLPSVMTCANYLKLPPYSCKEVLRDRLLYAITEGQGSFDLS